MCVCVCVCLGEAVKKPTFSLSSIFKSSLSSKSFEEQRLEYMAQFRGSTSSLWKVERKSLLSRRLWILDQLLKCKAIEDISMDLVRITLYLLYLGVGCYLQGSGVLCIEKYVMHTIPYSLFNH